MRAQHLWIKAGPASCFAARKKSGARATGGSSNSATASAEHKNPDAKPTHAPLERSFFERFQAKSFGRILQDVETKAKTQHPCGQSLLLDSVIRRAAGTQFWGVEGAPPSGSAPSGSVDGGRPGLKHERRTAEAEVKHAPSFSERGHSVTLIFSRPSPRNAVDACAGAPIDFVVVCAIILSPGIAASPHKCCRRFFHASMPIFRGVALEIRLTKAELLEQPAPPKPDPGPRPESIHLACNLLHPFFHRKNCDKLTHRSLNPYRSLATVRAGGAPVQVVYLRFGSWTLPVWRHKWPLLRDASWHRR